jgi:hypothetical protein
MVSRFLVDALGSMSSTCSDRIARRRAKAGTRGQAVLEIALLTPWIFFLFAGSLDMGFYSYALIATQEAARTAVEYTSRSAAAAADSSGACQYALAGMRAINNVRNLSSCSAAPLVVTARAMNDPDGFSESSVSVAYTTDAFIPIPGIARQFTITRTLQMMLR